MTVHKAPHKLLTPRFVFPALLLLIFLGIGSLLYALTPLSSILNAFFTPNYAEQTAKPLEKALVEKGGKVCDTHGDSGRGIDNQTPWYQVFYEVPLSLENAQDVVYSAASEGGYRLTRGKPSARGPLEVADIYIDKWHYDYESKSIPFPDLESGKVRLAFIVDGGADAHYNCGHPIPSGYSVVGIDVGLTSFR